MPSIYRLASAQQRQIGALIRRISERAGHTNVFNTSVVETGGRTYVCYRAFGPARTKPFHAFAATINADGSTTLVDLTAHCQSFGVRPTADPKLFVADDTVYATFNTGTPSTGENQIYLLRVSPSPGEPQRVSVVGRERTRVEKNWAFFIDGSTTEMQGVYSLSPTVLLRQVTGELGGQGDLVFEATERDSRVTGRMPRQLTIGTQPARLPSGDLLLIGHERFSVAGKRAYVGRAIRLIVDRPGPVRLDVSPLRLVHSYLSMVPRKGAHNPNLLSATYFSGLDVRDDLIRLSYGVNDVDFGIAEMKESVLWA